MFTTGFGDYVCEGDTIECAVSGFRLVATIYTDEDSSPPWKRDDGHGPVSNWTSRAKRPGERILNSDGHSHRYYDFAEAVNIAKRDGWGIPDGSPKGNQAAIAAEHDFKVLKTWCNDEWYYVCVAVTVYKAGILLTHEYGNALCGIECNCPGSDNSYLAEVANDLLDEAMNDAHAALAKLCVAEATA